MSRKSLQLHLGCAIPTTPPTLCKGGCGVPVAPPRRVWCEDYKCKERWLVTHYLSCAKEWVWRRDKGTCQECGTNCGELDRNMRLWRVTDLWHYQRMRRLFPDYAPGRSYGEVHHIVEKAEGGTDDPNNLTLLCIRCHKAHTADYNRRRKLV